VAKHN
jgi:hypothetical protein